VARAKSLADALGFARSCRDDDGKLLHVLAGRRGVERVGEIGTGAGVGTAWLASALPPGVALVTAERDERLARAVAELFADDPDVDVLEGDWRERLSPHAPFDLVFVDAGDAKDDPDAVLALASPGATIVLDDFSPGWEGVWIRVVTGGSVIRSWWRSSSGRGRERARSSRSSAADRVPRCASAGIVGRMASRAELVSTEHGLVPLGQGWYVLNARAAQWWKRDGRGALCEFEGAGFEGVTDFPQLGINLTVLGPGEPMAMYHRENDQEGFLVLRGEAVLVVEGEERPLRAWDFVHCPAGTGHVIVGAGEGPCLVLAVGARERSTGADWGAYTVDAAALRHGAGVERETTDPAEAYARFGSSRLTGYREGWLPA
jgi:uncharacterized cupin superfamily protein